MSGQIEHSALYGLQHATIGVIVLDSHRRVIAASETAETMVGTAQGQLRGRTLEDLHPHRNIDRIHALLDCARRGENGSSTSIIIPVPGRILLLKVAYFGVSDQEIPPLGSPIGGYLLTLFDVLAGETSLAPPPSSSLPPNAPFLLKIPVETPHGVSLLDLAETVFLKASGRYAEVYSKDGRPRLSNLSLKELEERLDPTRFLRVHRAFMINVAFAAAFRRRGDACELVMADRQSSTIPIGRSRVVSVRERLGL